MRLVKVEPQAPQALRVLVQGADDAGSIDFSLACASEWTSNSILVINATGKDLGAFGGRYDLVEIRDDADRPSRSLTEIIGVLEGIKPGAFGAAVVLDANRLYRAIRCAARDAKQVENLSAGQWDSANEALGLLGELLTRLGLPSVFWAPPTDLYGTDGHGEPVVVGTKPQAWKDLARSAHLHISVTRRRETVSVEVASDDWNRIGKPGTVIEGASGRSVGEAVADLARAAKAGQAAGTTLEEASAAELGARAARLDARREGSKRVRTRLLNIAELRAEQGRWDEFIDEVNGSLSVLEPKDLDAVSKKTDEVLAKHGDMLDWMRAASADLERHLTRSLHDLRPSAVGPSIARCPARDDMPVDQLLQVPYADHQLRECSGEDLVGWVASLAQCAGLWSDAVVAEPAFAAVCLRAGLMPKGPSWERYTDEELRNVALYLLSLAKTRTSYDPPTESKPAPPRLRAVAVDDRPTEATDSQPSSTLPTSAPTDPFGLPDEASDVTATPKTSGRRFLPIDIPTIREFDDLEKNEATDYLNILLLQGCWRDHLDDLCTKAKIAPNRPQVVHSWTRAERLAAYQVLLAHADHRMAS